MNLPDLAASSYIALETYRKNGNGVITPVWVTSEGEKLFVWTRSTTGKVKRIRHTSLVRLCASDGRGKPKSEWLPARARILSESAELKKQRDRMARKYGLQYHLLGFIERLGPNKDGNIVIELSPVEIED